MCLCPLIACRVTTDKGVICCCLLCSTSGSGRGTLSLSTPAGTSEAILQCARVCAGVVGRFIASFYSSEAGGGRHLWVPSPLDPTATQGAALLSSFRSSYPVSQALASPLFSFPVNFPIKVCPSPFSLNDCCASSSGHGVTLPHSVVARAAATVRDFTPATGESYMCLADLVLVCVALPVLCASIVRA